jgi:CRISPR-associated protein Cas1
MDDMFELDLAKQIIYQKTQNQITLLKKQKVSKSILEQVLTFQKQIQSVTHYQELMGTEGSIAKLFFANYFQNSDIHWLRRLPQTKYDVPNLLLDIGYSYLFNFVDSLLRLYGFDTYKGFYHKLFFERKSLSCDIMEVFRYLIDKTLLKAYNLGQIEPKDFKVKNGTYELDYQKSSKYLQIFLAELMDQRVEILTFIQSFYRYYMRPDKYTFPIIKFR